MKGERIAYDGRGIPPNGSYFQFADMWQAITPNGMLAGLANHDIVEREDGTISVWPSILVTGHDGSWHGYLERGVWREV